MCFKSWKQATESIAFENCFFDERFTFSFRVLMLQTSQRRAKKRSSAMKAAEHIQRQVIFLRARLQKTAFTHSPVHFPFRTLHAFGHQSAHTRCRHKQNSHAAYTGDHVTSIFSADARLLNSAFASHSSAHVSLRPQFVACCAVPCSVRLVACRAVSCPVWFVACHAMSWNKEERE